MAVKGQTVNRKQGELSSIYIYSIIQYYEYVYNEDERVTYVGFWVGALGPPKIRKREGVIVSLGWWVD